MVPGMNEEISMSGRLWHSMLVKDPGCYHWPYQNLGNRFNGRIRWLLDFDAFRRQRLPNTGIGSFLCSLCRFVGHQSMTKTLSFHCSLPWRWPKLINGKKCQDSSSTRICFSTSLRYYRTGGCCCIREEIIWFVFSRTIHWRAFPYSS